MRTVFLTAGLLALSASAFAVATPKPEQATYTVTRDGKTIGTATYSLAANAVGTWTLHSETRGTGGMAKLLGLDVREDSVFNFRDGRLQGLRYDYRQDAAIKHKERTIDFDENAGQIRVHDNGKDFRYALVDGAIDRSAVAVALGLALADGATTMEFPVTSKDRIEQQRFAVRATEEIHVPAGSFRAARVERTDAQGKAQSWYAPNAGVLPLRVEQKQHDGSTIVMERK